MKTAIDDLYSYKDFTIAGSLIFKDIDGKKGIVTGYFADFNTTDSDGDIIKQGAFDKTIKATGPTAPKPRVKHLMNHDISSPLGRLMVLKEDNKGLYYESQIGNHSLGVDFIKMADSGLITEHSIGYRTIKYNQVKPWEDWKDGEVARELTELKLYEGSSLTAWGANPNTPLTGIKNESEKNKIIARAEAIEKFCRDSSASDETIDMLLLYNKQLLQIIADANSTQPVLAIVPDAKATDPMTTCPYCDHQMTMTDAVANNMVCDNCDRSIVKSSMPETVECPSCNKHTYNTQAEKGFIKCHRCSAMFNYGSKLFVKL